MSERATSAIHTDAQLWRLVHRLSPEEKTRLLTGADFWALCANDRIGLRRMVFSDGPAGVRGEFWDERHQSLNIPSPVALAASWDPERVQRIGELLGDEARRLGVDVLLAPAVNLHRSPLAGRNFEVFSEDPLLTARLAVAYVRGVQSRGVAATAKHFVANDSETLRRVVDVRVDERTLHEAYLAPFEAMVREGGVWAVMASYNKVEGVTMTESPLLQRILRERWRFDGLIMSDWGATRSVAPSVSSALDVAMPGPQGPWVDGLMDALEAGEVSEATIDEHVLNLLRLAARVGALRSEPAPLPGDPGPTELAELRSAAAAGMVLTRNRDGLLPLARTNSSIAVIGPNAAVPRSLGGGSATVFAPYNVSPLEGLRAALPQGADVRYEPGVQIWTRQAAAGVDVLTNPRTGEAGCDLAMFGADGTELVREHRRTGRFTWLSAAAPGVPAGHIAAIEVSARVKAPVTGEYVLGCSVVGAVSLSLDGEVAAQTELELPPGADPFDRIGRPPQLGVGRRLEAGQEVHVIIRHAVVNMNGKTLELTVDLPAEPAEDMLARAVSLAATCETAVVVVGTTEEVESEGYDRIDLRLPGRQEELVRRVCTVNARTVVVVNSGAPVHLEAAEDAGAVLLTWFPGQEFGNALADVLLGAQEPGGRSPVTWPGAAAASPSVTPIDGVLTYAEGLDIGYRRLVREGGRALVSFGEGLGYTSWEYLGAETESDGEGGCLLNVTVRNSGTRRGREVVQVYLSRPSSAVDRPAIWLGGFATAHLEPGVRTDVTVRLPRRVFEHWEPDGEGWSLEAGEFTALVGRSSVDIRLTRQVPISHDPAG